jgi:hypothetical protein
MQSKLLIIRQLETDAKDLVINAWTTPCIDLKILLDSHIPKNPPTTRPVNHSVNSIVCM